MKNLLHKLFVGLGVTKTQKQTAFNYPNPIPRLRAALEQSDTEKDVQRLFEIAVCLSRFISGSQLTFFKIECQQRKKIIRLADQLQKNGCARETDQFSANELFAIEIIAKRFHKRGKTEKYFQLQDFLNEKWQQIIQYKSGYDKLFST